MSISCRADSRLLSCLSWLGAWSGLLLRGDGVVGRLGLSLYRYSNRCLLLNGRVDLVYWGRDLRSEWRRLLYRSRLTRIWTSGPNLVEAAVAG